MPRKWKGVWFQKKAKGGKPHEGTGRGQRRKQADRGNPTVNPGAGFKRLGKAEPPKMQSPVAVPKNRNRGQRG